MSQVKDIEKSYPSPCIVLLYVNPEFKKLESQVLVACPPSFARRVLFFSLSLISFNSAEIRDYSQLTCIGTVSWRYVVNTENEAIIKTLLRQHIAACVNMRMPKAVSLTEVS